jgi:DNA-binding transcriptional ArsR family regulator
MLPGRSGKSCTELLKILADKTRLAVLMQLMHGPQYVQELNASLGVEQTLFSHHLKILRQIGFVIAERSGKGVLYRLAPGVGNEKKDAINLGCCELKF